MSTIKIRLPDPLSGTPEEFLKQLELCVHHARKALAVQREDQGDDHQDENDYCKFTCDDIYTDIKKLEVTDLPISDDVCNDMFWEDLQNIELEISIN